MSYKDDLQKTLDLLKRERDEISLKLHLGQKDLQDEMAAFDKQWEDFKSKGEKALAAADESSEDVAEALKLLGDELKSGFDKVRKALG